MKKLIFLFIPLILFACKSTQVPVKQSNSTYISQDRLNYISTYKNIAIKEMNRCGIPASITLAQAMLESDNGNSKLAKKANNHFGIKCHNSWDGDKVYHDDDKRGECFRKYDAVYDSYHDHSDFIVNGNRYKFLFDYRPTDYKSWAKGLQKAGYATSRTYAALLIKIIEDNQLYLLDKGIVSSSSQEPAADSQQVKLGNIDNFKIQVNRHTINTKNRIDYITVKKGDTFSSLTEEFQKLSWELYKYNELPQDAVLKIDQIIYLQPKRNSAEPGSNYHVVMDGETMYDISQFYGIKLKKLYEKNRMKDGSEPEIGQKLWLRKTKPEIIEGNTEEKPVIEFDNQ